MVFKNYENCYILLTVSTMNGYSLWDTMGDADIFNRYLWDILGISINYGIIIYLNGLLHGTMGYHGILWDSMGY